MSGIDSTIKIFSPDALAQSNAREGLNIGSASNDSSGYSWATQRRQRGGRGDAPNSGEEHISGREGLSSCKRMQQSYQIMAQNDVERVGGMRDAFITVRFYCHLSVQTLVVQLVPNLIFALGTNSEGCWRNWLRGCRRGMEWGTLTRTRRACRLW